MNSKRFNVLIPEESYQGVIQLLSKELEKEYSKTQANRGRRLLGNVISVDFEGEDGRAEVVEGGETHVVSMTLPVFDFEDGYSIVSCTCLREQFQLEPQRCAHLWASQKTLLDLIKSLADDRDRKLDEEGELFDSWDEFLEEKNSSKNLPVVDGEPGLSWMINEDFKPVPLKKSCRNGRVSYKNLTWPRLYEERSLWFDKPDQKLLAFVRLASSQELSESEDFNIIWALSQDQTMDVLNHNKKPLKLLVTDTLLVGRRKDENLIIEPCFRDGTKIQYLDDKGGALGYSQSDELLVARLGEREAKLFDRLLQQLSPIPISDKDKLYQYLSRINEKIPVSLDSVEPGEDADDVIILRLEPYGDNSIRVGVWVKPTETSAYMIPGLGPETVLDFSDKERPVARSRRLWDEQERAMSLVNRLSLHDKPQISANAFLLHDHHEGLVLMDRLQSSGSESDCILEWPKGEGRKFKGSASIGRGSRESVVYAICWRFY